MPYKEQEFRKAFDNTMVIPFLHNPSQLSYALTQVIKKYLEDKKKCWDEFSNVIKAVDSAIDAYKEEVLLPYEREKRILNGDVF